MRLPTRHILHDITRRKAGFKVVTRPRTGPATWERDGFLFTDEEALKIARARKPAVATKEAQRA